MAKGKLGDRIKITSYEDMLGLGSDTFGQVDQSQGAQIIDVPLEELHDFKGHPFNVVDDEQMEEMVESIKENGVLVPAMARPRAEGGYELLSGHRRHRACELAELETMPVIIKDVSDDIATVIMVDANIQRENILVSEKARAYKMKYDAIKHQGITGGISLDVMSESIRIAGEDYPYSLVKSKFLKLNYQHLEYVIGCMERNTTKVANIKAYLITALYNAPNTINHYYTAEVNHDMYG